MGIRYRKSINLGGGFRVNISKSGVGYSWGSKGYRITKMANGGVRQTVSIPGTGISYVNQTNGRQSHTFSNCSSSETVKIENKNASSIASPGLEDILSAAKTTLLLNKITKILLFVFGIFCFFNALFLIPLLFLSVLMLYIRKAGVVDLSYSIDEYQKKTLYARLAHILKAAKSERVWRVVESSKSSNIKYSSGASNLLKRLKCTVSTTAQFPFSSNTLTVSFKSKKETLIFFPDKLFIVQGAKIGALNYGDISMNGGTTRFVEEDRVPRDSKVVGKTWKYVNVAGGPDRRFKYNRELPICLYGKIRLVSHRGLNTLIMFSNTTG